jgi:protein-disulfide isomerase
MNKLIGAVFALLVAFAALPACAQNATAVPATVAPEQKAAFEKIVHDYLIEHPEVIKEAILALQAKDEANKADTQAQAVAAHKDELFSDPATPVAGNPVGDVTIVEFFDYHCPYCKAVAEPLDQLLRDDKGIRLVLKEFPILGEDSLLASRAALAAVAQGKYWPFHQALMAHRGKFDSDTLQAIATKVGLDPAKLQAAMNGDAVGPQISATRKLADALDVSATPTFVIGGEIVEGAVPLERLKELVKKARGS